jgi:basic amino acid/polyamine antiporter, APA family
VWLSYSRRTLSPYLAGRLDLSAQRMIREIRGPRKTQHGPCPEATLDPKLVPAEIPKPGDAPTGAPPEAPTLARALSLFDITMLVMGSVIGAGIFVVPHDVAKVVHRPELVLIAWVLGGVVSLAGSLVYADLVRRRPHVGGQYAFLREAYHPVVAFLYGWCLLWVIQSGGMASVAVVFARYFMELGNLFPAILSGSPAEAPGTAAGGTAAGDTLVGKVIAAVTIACLTAVNCLGVRTASTAQNLFMALKVLAIGVLIACGLLVALPSGGQSGGGGRVAETAGAWWMVPALAAALVPVLFAYGGWHTTTFMAAEVRDARRNLPRGLLLGVAGVTVLYLGVNYVCLRVLGVEELAANGSPAYEVMRRALGGRGAALLSAGIAVSALGFLSQAVLTSPRVYFAMARDGLFFQAVARIHPRTRVPVVAILLQGAFASVIAVSGTFHQILNYVMSVELVFLALTALSLFILRRRDKEAIAARDTVSGHTVSSDTVSGHTVPGDTVPGHPVTTLLFAAATLAVVAAIVYEYPANSAIGFGIAAAGVPVYAFWRWWNRGGKNTVELDHFG